MHRQSLLSLLAGSISLVSAAEYNLHVSHYSGYVYTLALDTGISSRKYNSHIKDRANVSLTITDSLQSCGDLPSWLTFDAASSTLYCSDESGTSANVGNGSLTSYSVAADGSLTELTKVDTLPGGVASVIYEGDDGQEYLAIAHYEGSAVSNFALPLTADSQALQTFEYTLSQPGANPSRQDAPHPHEVFLDPTGSFVLSPDLGSDVVRVFAIDKSTGTLNECFTLDTTPGNGPRHGVFWTPPVGSFHASTILYIVNELGNDVSTYSVSKTDDCLSLSLVQNIVPYPDGTAIPSTANVAEISLVGSQVYVSVRNDQAFPPADSVATLSVSKTTGTLSFGDLTSAYGKTPRTFVINKAGDLVAIGDQASSTVAIVRRDTTTGKLGPLLASQQVGVEGQVGQSNGLSSVIWAE